MASFFIATSDRSCQNIENETVAKEREVGEGDDKNVGGGVLIKMES